MDVSAAAPDLESLLTLPAIHALSGDAFLRRGYAYLREGRVASLAVDGGCLMASVRGTEDYGVRIWVGKDGELAHDCTCPMGREDGRFCKHCVAAALGWLGLDRFGAEGGTPRLSLDGLRDYLRKQTPELLVELLVDEARRDQALRERIAVLAARQADAGGDAAEPAEAEPAAASG